MVSQFNVTDAQYGLTSGFTDFAQRQVQVGGWLNPEERIAVLAHELGHVLLHGPDDNVGKLYGSSVDHRGLAEVEAESVAYTVLKAHGIDRGPQSASYLSGWADAVIEAEHSAAGARLLPEAACFSRGHSEVRPGPRHGSQPSKSLKSLILRDSVGRSLRLKSLRRLVARIPTRA